MHRVSVSLIVQIRCIVLIVININDRMEMIGHHNIFKQFQIHIGP